MHKLTSHKWVKQQCIANVCTNGKGVDLFTRDNCLSNSLKQLQRNIALATVLFTIAINCRLFGGVSVPTPCCVRTYLGPCQWTAEGCR